MGTHDVFIADILSVSCRGDIVDESGRADFSLANLLAYAHGEYYALGDKLGKIGFSTDKGRVKKEEKTPFYKAVAKPQKKSPDKNKDKGKPKRRSGK